MDERRIGGRAVGAGVPPLAVVCAGVELPEAEPVDG
jgi:hypothetical protein